MAAGETNSPTQTAAKTPQPQKFLRKISGEFEISDCFTDKGCGVFQGLPEC